MSFPAAGLTYVVGNEIASVVIPASAIADLDPNPNGGPGGDDDESFQIVRGYALFWLFVGAIVAMFFLALRLPLHPTWEHHARFQTLFRFAPVVVLGVLWLTHLVPTKLIVYWYTPRVFASYLAAIAGCIYFVVFKLNVPAGVIAELEKNPRAVTPEQQSVLSSNPTVRYILTLLGGTSFLISCWLTLLLVPNSFTMAPENWWEIFLPW